MGKCYRVSDPVLLLILDSVTLLRKRYRVQDPDTFGHRPGSVLCVLRCVCKENATGSQIQFPETSYPRYNTNPLAYWPPRRPVHHAATNSTSENPERRRRGGFSRVRQSTTPQYQFTRVLAAVETSSPCHNTNSLAYSSPRRPVHHVTIPGRGLIILDPVSLFREDE